MFLNTCEMPKHHIIWDRGSTPYVPKYKQKWINISRCIWYKFWTKYINFCWPIYVLSYLLHYDG